MMVKKKDKRLSTSSSTRVLYDDVGIEEEDDIDTRGRRR